ncbi:MAG: PilN domain-containing protein [Xenococcaceae cyanobacterium]
MYSLDINFLKDRNLDRGPGERPEKKKQKKPIGTMIPLIAGVVVMVLLPAAAGGSLLILNEQKAEIEKEIKEIKAKINRMNAQDENIEAMKKKIAQINDETKALVSVFNQIKPWSAILQDIGDYIPPEVQIDSIQQSQSQPDKKSSNPPKIQLTITGIASSYNDVNDFLLTLQRSKFLKAEKTKLESAELIDFPVKELDRKTLLEKLGSGQLKDIPRGLEDTQNLGAKQGKLKDKYNFPKVVKYTIKTEPNDIPASELLQELDSKGAVGLVTRIRTLEQKGVIQP